MKAESKYRFLEIRPESVYRQPFIKGTRVRVEIVFGCTVPKEDEDGLQPGLTPEEVADSLQVPVEAVREAIDWCQRNWDVVVGDHAREDRIMEASGMNHPDYKRDPKRHYKPMTPEQWTKIGNDEDLP